jgi:hypothetical protein
VHPGKSDCLILDLVGVTDHELVTVASLAGLDHRVLATKPVTEALADPKVCVPVEGTWAAELQATEINLFRRRPLAWVRADRSWLLPTGNGSTVTLEPVAAGWRVVDRQRGQMPRIVASKLTLDWAQGVGEDLVRERGGLHLARGDAPWRHRPATKKQVAMLRRMRLTHPPTVTSGEASDLIAAGIASRSA